MSSPGFYNWLSFVSLKPSHQWKGLSSILLESLFSFLQEKEYDHLLSSGYTEKGYHALRKKLISLSETNNIRFKDFDKISF